MLVVKMDGDSRLARQFRFANAALDLGNRLACQHRIHLIRGSVVTSNGRTDALGRILSNLKCKPEPLRNEPISVIADYLKITYGRLPRYLKNAIVEVAIANDLDPAVVGVRHRRYAIAQALRVLAGKVRNARIGLNP